MRRFLVGLLLVVACSSDQGAMSQSGSLDLVMHGVGGGSAGAVVLVISGAPVDAITPAAGFELGSIADGAGTHVILTGPIADGTVATMNVPDASRVSAYLITVEQVADGSTFGLLDPARVSATVTPHR